MTDLHPIFRDIFNEMFGPGLVGHPKPPRFPKTYCSQCGREFGPGDSGYSHCKDHRMARGRERHARHVAAVAAIRKQEPV